uniref:J domain-containing protein n=1 Tax=Babesia bovis TaxID=5865 RepID=S6AZ05_BABBO|nr:hypothetical protein [Babesia bovis]
MSEDLPSILKGVDLLSVLGVEVVEGVSISDVKRDLRRLFLKRAKECHPDKQKSTDGGSDSSLAFARLKAAFDYIQNDGVFNSLYNRALHKKRAEKARKERATGIAAKQSAHLEALLRREQAAANASRRDSGVSTPRDYSSTRSGFNEEYEAFSRPSDDFTSRQGTLFVAARNMRIANESEVNCLLLSDHFTRMFPMFGLVKVEPIDIEDLGPDAINVKIGILTFDTHEHALKALLHYRNHRESFRCDLYALALGPQSFADKPSTSTDNSESLDELESTVFRRLRQAAEKKRKTGV